MMTTATAGVFDSSNAFSMALAACPIDRPGRSGVAMPMGPEKRSSGTTGPWPKNHMREASLKA